LFYFIALYRIIHVLCLLFISYNNGFQPLQLQRDYTELHCIMTIQTVNIKHLKGSVVELSCLLNTETKYEKS